MLRWLKQKWKRVDQKKRGDATPELANFVIKLIIFFVIFLVVWFVGTWRKKK